MCVDWAIRSVKEQRWGHGRHKPRNFTRNRDSLMAPLSRRLIHAALSVGLSLLAVTAMAFAGAVVADAESHVRAAAQELTDLPMNRPSSSGAIVVAVVLGSSGTVGSDVLAPYEVFASSRIFPSTQSQRGPSLPPSTGVRRLCPRTRSRTSVRAGPGSPTWSLSRPSAPRRGQKKPPCGTGSWNNRVGAPASLACATDQWSWPKPVCWTGVRRRAIGPVWVL